MNRRYGIFFGRKSRKREKKENTSIEPGHIYYLKNNSFLCIITLLPENTTMIEDDNSVLIKLIKNLKKKL